MTLACEKWGAEWRGPPGRCRVPPTPCHGSEPPTPGETLARPTADSLDAGAVLEVGQVAADGAEAGQDLGVRGGWGWVDPPRDTRPGTGCSAVSPPHQGAGMAPTWANGVTIMSSPCLREEKEREAQGGDRGGSQGGGSGLGRDSQVAGDGRVAGHGFWGQVVVAVGAVEEGLAALAMGEGALQDQPRTRAGLGVQRAAARGAILQVEAARGEGTRLVRGGWPRDLRPWIQGHSLGYATTFARLSMPPSHSAQHTPARWPLW